MSDATHFIIGHDATIRDCVKSFADTHAGIVLFVDANGRFAGLLTAGNVFRLLAQGVSLDDAVTPHINSAPITVNTGFSDAEILRLMSRRGITQVPVLRPDGTLERVVSQAALLRSSLLTNSAVIMAGGEGLRLRPLTEQIPKALVPVQGKPLLVHIIERLAQFGILDITIALRYRADDIREAIGDGRTWHVNVRYVEESEPLGTCGALTLVKDGWENAMFVLNCDVLSEIDLLDMHRFHQLNRSDFTLAVKDHEVEVPFGIVEVDHERVVGLSEKPKLKFYVNAGIYLISPEARRAVPPRRYDTTELITDLVQRGMNVCSFPLRRAWADIGDPASLRLANGEADE
ncbi:MAG: sugar phosphate nucleotidyltransferase [Vicinamibacterales bacterium]